MKADLSVQFTTVKGDTDERYYFAAAAQTVGFELVENTPKISNTYSTERVYEPGEPGDVRYYLPWQKGRIMIEDLVEVWLEPAPALREAEGFLQRILHARDADALHQVCSDFDLMYQKAVIAHMRLMMLGKIRLPDLDPDVPEEVEALQILDKFTANLETALTDKDRKKAAQLLKKHWQPALAGWLKAYRSNFLELRNLWVDIPQTLKIARKGRLPLILPKGPKFREMLERWT